jgi:hypothetical protein
MTLSIKLIKAMATNDLGYLEPAIALESDAERPSLLQVARANLAPGNFNNASEMLLRRLSPQAEIFMQPDIQDKLRQGNCLVLYWPHISFFDVPLGLASLGVSAPDMPLTKSIVALMPGPLFPPEAIPVRFMWEDIMNGLRSDIPSNRFAAFGNMLLSYPFSGKADYKRRENSKTIDTAVEHLFSGGNIAMWPSGPDMIGRWHTGAGRIVSQVILKLLAQHRPTNIIFGHSATFPDQIIPGILSAGDYPIAFDYQHGPTTGEILDYLNPDLQQLALNPADREHSYATSHLIMQELERRFHLQGADFIGKLVVRGFPDHAINRVQDVYDRFDTSGEG